MEGAKILEENQVVYSHVVEKDGIQYTATSLSPKRFIKIAEQYHKG